MSITIGLIVVAVVVILYLVSLYNKLVTLKGRFENAFAQIEVQLKRRYDLIPNLIEVAKKYLQHESETLLNVTAARNAAVSALQAAAANPTDAGAIEALNGAEKKLTSNLGGLSVQMEAYPELKANTTMMQLSEELTSTENRVSFARQAFNDAVTAYNIQRKTFPTALFASAFGHSQDGSLLVFEDSAAIQAAPKVSF